MFSAAMWGTPLCHFVTSPPQGGRVEPHALRFNTFDHGAKAGGFPLSPLVGEMSGRTEGGNPNLERPAA
jgi:hypothetical protein